MSSRRGQSDGSFRLAWHPKPGAARTMSTRPYLLGPFQLADGWPRLVTTMAPSRNIGEGCP
jgi:hypothetical protein